MRKTIHYAKLKEVTIIELQSALQDEYLSKAELLRVQAVPMRKRDLKWDSIAEVVGKNLSVVEDGITAYNHHGLEGLRTKKRAVPARAYLSPTQQSYLSLLLKKEPRKLSIDIEQYWTMNAVKQLVDRVTGAVYKSLNSYCPVLNPQEHVWKALRNDLAKGVHQYTYSQFIDRACYFLLTKKFTYDFGVTVDLM